MASLTHVLIPITQAAKKRPIGSRYPLLNHVTAMSLGTRRYIYVEVAAVLPVFPVVEQWPLRHDMHTV